MAQRITISVIGSRELTDPKEEQVGFEVGKLVAQAPAVLVCGGLGGSMKAAARGASSVGGLTIGLLPGIDKKDANPFIDIALPTSIGFARNAMVACSSDLIIALPGSHGTCSEIAYGLIYNRTVFDFGNWNIQGTIKIRDLQDLKEKIDFFIRSQNA